MKIIAILLSSFLGAYLVFSFILNESNPFKWHEYYRLMLVISGFISFAINRLYNTI